MKRTSVQSVLLSILCWGALPFLSAAEDISGEVIQDGLSALYTYSVFTNAYSHFENANQIVSSSNYERFLDYVSERYRESFTQAELQMLLGFLNSPLGQKWKQFEAQADIWLGFPRSLPALIKTEIVYTCSEHPLIQSKNPGQCPICGEAMVGREITDLHRDRPMQSPRKAKDIEGVVPND